jgi:hypothetical protein
MEDTLAMPTETGAAELPDAVIHKLKPAKLSKKGVLRTCELNCGDRPANHRNPVPRGRGTGRLVSPRTGANRVNALSVHGTTSLA